ncbi:MAG TPA: hypothetical protein VHG72_14510 [Polyangia bacterium]|nr:hypothetical protein [Polyangia bacterium]
MVRGAVLAVAFGMLAGTGSCGSTLSAIPLSRSGQAERTLTLSAGTAVQFETDVHPTQVGAVRAEYDIELLQGGHAVAEARCLQELSEDSPSCAVRQVSYNEDRHITCRMTCSARVPKSGPTVVRAKLVVEGHPTLVDADEPPYLIVEQ